MRIGLVYPELLGTYGDRGNAVVLVQRCTWRGIPAELVEVRADEPIPDSLDVYLFGGGEDDSQLMAADGMRASRDAIVRAHEGGAVVLAVCAGFQLVGHRYEAADGAVLEGIGLVDMVTRPGPDRLIGEVVVEPGPSVHWGAVGAPAHPHRLREPRRPHDPRPRRRAARPSAWPAAATVTAPGSTVRSPSDSSAPTSTGPVLPMEPRAGRSAPRVGARRRPKVGLPELPSPLEDALHAERLDAGTSTGLSAWYRRRRLARG